MTWPLEDDAAWRPVRQHWSLPEGLTYLNHGSFGLPTRAVIQVQGQYLDRAAAEPMDFFVRELEPELIAARDRLADFVGADRGNLVFVENATYGMNVVAESVGLAAGDEVVMTTHEYGAVFRIWHRKCEEVGARVVEAKLPPRLESSDEIVDAVLAALTPKTKLVVFSHITSATAMKLPAERITRAVQDRGVAVCIDGPHAPGILPLELDALGCEYYTAVCHKWLSAAHGTGFLYVHPQVQATVRPSLLSWGRVQPAVPETWQDEFTWTGTRDMATYLSLPAALDFLAEFGWETLRRRTHYLARYARESIANLTGHDALIPDEEDWYGAMITMPLRNDGRPWVEFRDTLRSRFQIEALVYDVNEQRFIRTSCYLYNTKDDVDHLVEALRVLLY
ncbi:MAG: aminotransferase class V-fold PLP-dependent enzyme [Planctomycetota bacterium]|nr:MAG: aminotransferase class V-fold PLP-dependent enzyme [Planctomycetota bacterium]REJ93694.1 MAG: aminotransferase class V-fold PLP-dependent enzyme [Planctomycetota bacterium]